MAEFRHPSRPTRTDDLVRRLGSRDIDPKERNALEALSKEMILVFQDERHLSYVSEAAALATVVTASNYRDLAQAFNNTIIKGTADGNILDTQVLSGFTFVLRCAEDAKRDEMQLGPVLESLQKRLDGAMKQAESKTQYKLICTLSSVLDAMVDIGTAGLGREDLHEPLLKQLATLSKSQELRLAQSAGYAYQALLGIPNDEGPYGALLRHTSNIARSTGNLATAVSAMDPAKLFGSLQNVPHLISSMVEVVRALSGLASSLETTTEGVRYLQKQKSWYVALRFTDMFIQAKAFDCLKDFLSKVPCRQEKEFLCGVFAQLENAWKSKETSVQGQIVQFLEQVLVPAGSKSIHRRVHEWVKLVADTMGRPDWTDVLQPARGRWQSRPWKQTEYTSTIPCLERRDESRSADLLKQAWSRCTEAQLFYADVRIRQYYLEEKRLMVERLSGESLSMDQCYINLAIVDSSGKGVNKVWDSPFPLFARLRVETPDENTQVSLGFLFNQQKGRNARAPPKRIFIQGQAGVGKTTLCKRIVYEYLYEGMWTDSFDRLICVPLRTLKDKSPEYTLKHWLLDVHFRAADGEILAEAVRQAVHDPDSCGRTLFILDGLDEVSRELDPEIPGLLWDLLNQPDVIITSRPGTSLSHVNCVDLELETVGFYPEQVQAYISKVAPDHAREIQSFLDSRWLLQGLVRIPIQLEALCYSWEAGMANSDVASTTMTMLYYSIEQKLWKKDVVRLEKSSGGKPFSMRVAKSTLDSEISSQIKLEVNLLRCLAFTGLYNDIIEFDKELQEQIWKYWTNISEHLQSGGALPSSLDLAKLSFLRSSGVSSVERNQSYHFLHLTFQEYFAAQYFVEHWKSNTSLPCLALNGGGLDAVSTEVFLLKEKYNVRYNIFWRFVAGLLQPHGNGEHLCRFFDTIEKEPRDLLGPTHQRLVMHCLSEVVPSEKTTAVALLRRKLENQLSEWLLFESNFLKTAQLAREMELPDQVLDNVFQGAPEEVVTMILTSISARPRVSLRIIGLSTAQLQQNASKRLRFAALGLLYRQVEALPNQTIKAVVAQLDDQDVSIVRAAAQTLGRQSLLPEEILKAAAERLNSPDGTVRSAAVRVLGTQTTLPDDILEALTLQLECRDSTVRRTVVGALVCCSALPTQLLQVIATQLGDRDRGIQQAAAKVLRRQSALSKEILAAIAAHLKNQDGVVRQAAVEALERQRHLPAHILASIAAQLKDRDKAIRQAVVETLKAQDVLPESILAAIEAHLRDQDRNLRQAAVEILEEQFDLPEYILMAIVAQLEEQNGPIRQSALKTLENKSVLPKHILASLVPYLGDQDSTIREASATVFNFQADLPEEIFKAMIAKLKDGDEETIDTVALAFQYRIDLPKEIRKEIIDFSVAQLQNHRVVARERAIRILRNQSQQSAIPEQMLKVIAARLHDESRRVQKMTIEILARQSALPEEFLEATVAWLHDQDEPSQIPQSAVTFGQPALLKRLFGRFTKPLYCLWLTSSFLEHLVCYVADGVCYINSRTGRREISLEGEQDRFTEAVQEIQKEMSVPLRPLLFPGINK
ncbi:hypothetical protein AK830_g9636 [Neonectria ditissima]|uniref:NACHT domain-containing protein n=1 Tax=Neonectria ditissima TaxID=78410 RepID=A0A0N8H5R8_9HYPO|nr:hypothetical protein AK830_g9636 [Neonectria ditissima]